MMNALSVEDRRLPPPKFKSPATPKINLVIPVTGSLKLLVYISRKILFERATVVSVLLLLRMLPITAASNNTFYMLTAVARGIMFLGPNPVNAFSRECL